MMEANGYNPLRWDCERQGCFNLKRRPKIEVFADCFPGRISLLHWSVAESQVRVAMIVSSISGSSW